VDFDEGFRPVASLTRWERLTPTLYRFHLRPDRRRFHDGTPLTAEDVAATYRSVLDPQVGSPHRGSLHMLKRIEVVDADTVDFHLTVPDPLFPGRLVVGILPAPLLAAGHAFNADAVGSGPFRFVSWPEAERLRIQRLADGAAVEFLRVAKPDVRILKLLRGELDATQGDMPPELLGWVAAREGVQVLKREGTTFAYLGFNMDDPVVGDLRVRRAVAHALDRDAIIRYLWAGHARPAVGILTADHWAGHPDLAAPGYDPEAARRLLREAGYGPEKPAHIVYKTSTNPLRVRIATVIQDQLSRVGIVLDIRTYDWGTFYGDIKAGNFQLFSLAWVGIKMPDIFRYVFHSASMPPGGANRGRWSEPRMDALIEQAEAAQDLDEQARLYREVQELVMAQLPYVPLWYEDQVFIARPDVVGYTMSRDGNYDGLVTAKWGTEGRQ
jgi:peptide/nickel transport system substrate-binding protein